MAVTSSRQLTHLAWVLNEARVCLRNQGVLSFIEYELASKPASAGGGNVQAEQDCNKRRRAPSRKGPTLQVHLATCSTSCWAQLKMTSKRVVGVVCSVAILCPAEESKPDRVPSQEAPVPLPEGEDCDPHHPGKNELTSTGRSTSGPNRNCVLKSCFKAQLQIEHPSFSSIESMCELTQGEEWRWLLRGTGEIIGPKGRSSY
eukprot:4743304-Amphidinium_carterae.1